MVAHERSNKAVRHTEIVVFADDNTRQGQPALEARSCVKHPSSTFRRRGRLSYVARCSPFRLHFPAIPIVV
jgi:hypothetical protein